MADSPTIDGCGASKTTVPEVTLLSRETVPPASPSPSDPFFLSCLDILWQEIHYNRRLLFYQNPQTHPPLPGPHGDDGPGQNALLMMQQLKRGLSLCLVHYFCWCGRLAKGVDPPHRLFVDCNDAGVEFVEASVDVPLSKLAEDGFQMKPFFDQLCQELDHKGDCLFSSPLLSVQVTLFSDGGLALGIVHSHVIADGQSLWNFMVSWGECSRGIPLSVPPLHDRQRLAVLDPSPEKATWKLDFDLSEDDKAELEKNLSMNEDMENCTVMDLSTSADKERDDSSSPADASGEGGKHRREDMGQEDNENGPTDTDNSSANGSQTHPKPGADLVQWMFTLSASAIKKLKNEAGGGYTSFEVTCAHFWQRTCVARNAPVSERTYLFAPVNCRSRIVPPMPPAYFGNVLGFGVVRGIVSKIRRETLHDTASRIHSKIAAVKEDHVEAMMHWLETHDNRVMSTAGANSRESLGKGLNVASSPWFPAYQVDFGWGKPAAVRTAKVKGDGELVFFGGHPGSEVGDVEICTALPRDVVERLFEDPAFVAKSPCAFALH